jgi:hypothetical protein
MTKTRILQYVTQAEHAVARGDCYTAMQAITNATTGAASLKGYGASGVRKRVAQAYARVAGSGCVGEGLLPPSGETARGNTPDFSGALALPDTVSKFKHVVGFAAAVVGLTIGIGALYKSAR